ncbi:MAG: hypothetical protein PHE68_03885 [Candidatus Peribacteraceae bacterium]|nr:hypothetical protein [Candidatus Peribacteraceae bacterium]MDD5074902.1 hypothetical protein [Candidatus Peribacteraceae bacterium]
MTIFFSILGIAASILLIAKRERAADMLGSAEWMDYFGGPYSFIVIVSICMFFVCVSFLFGITDILFTPLKWLIPRSMLGGQ